MELNGLFGSESESTKEGLNIIDMKALKSKELPMGLSELFGSDSQQEISFVDEKALEAGELSSEDLSLDAGDLGGFEFGSQLEEKEAQAEKPDIRPILRFAREEMLKGKMGQDLTKSLKAKYSSDILKLARKELTELLKYEGIMGTIVIDATGFKSRKEALQCTKNSPYKSNLKYIMGGNGEYHELADYDNTDYLNTDYEANFDNAIDNYFDEVNYSEKTSKFCKATGLIVISGYSDLDDDTMDNDFVEGINIGDNERTNLYGDKDKKDKKKSSLQIIQQMFKDAAMSKTRSLQYAVPPEDTVQYKVEQGELLCEVAEEKKASEVIVDPVNHAADQEIELFSSIGELGGINTKTGDITLDLDDPFGGSIDIEEQAK